MLQDSKFSLFWYSLNTKTVVHNVAYSLDELHAKCNQVLALTEDHTVRVTIPALLGLGTAEAKLSDLANAKTPQDFIRLLR